MTTLEDSKGVVDVLPACSLYSSVIITFINDMQIAAWILRDL